MKKLFALILVLVLSISTVAFGDGILVTFDVGSITFYTDKDNVGVFSEATTQSEQVDIVNAKSLFTLPFNKQRVLASDVIIKVKTSMSFTIISGRNTVLSRLMESTETLLITYGFVSLVVTVS